MGTGEVRQRRVVIEYLRGFAALLVAWFHLTNGYGSGSLVRASGSFCWLGVEVFFVISGVIIPYSLSTLDPAYRLSDFGRFILRRIIRIEIPYLASIAVVISLGFASAATPGFRGHAPHYDVGQVAAHAFYLIPLTGYSWLQPVYWTLMYEFVFYLFMGLAFAFIGRAGQLVQALALSTAVVGLVAANLIPERVCLFVAGFWLYRAILHQEKLAGAVLVLASLCAALARQRLSGRSRRAFSTGDSAVLVRAVSRQSRCQVSRVSRGGLVLALSRPRSGWWAGG